MDYKIIKIPAIFCHSKKQDDTWSHDVTIDENRTQELKVFLKDKATRFKGVKHDL